MRLLEVAPGLKHQTSLFTALLPDGLNFQSIGGGLSACHQTLGAFTSMYRYEVPTKCWTQCSVKVNQPQVMGLGSCDARRMIHSKFETGKHGMY
jgi:hypothetical protein